MFVRNAWYVAALATEVGRSLTQRWIVGDPVVLYRTENGTPVALEDRCPHRFFALSKGRLVGDDIECGYHGLTFDCTGTCIGIPGQANIPPRLRARAYPVVERWNWLWIWPGDPDKADPALIPDFHWNDDPDWDPVGGHIHYDAQYQLLVDNLLDLTHETFVHRNTIGNAAVAHTPAKTTVEDPVVRVERVMRDCPAPPLFEKVRGFAGNIDRWQLIRFEPPANIWIDARGLPAGTNDADNGLRWFVLNSITPETESSCHYFWAISRCFAQGDAQISSLIHDQIYTTFMEDKDVLETQQRMIETERHGRPLLSVNADAALVAARRITDRLIAEEAEGSA